MLCNEGRISVLCFALSSCLALLCEILLRIESEVFLKLSYGTFIVHAVTYGLLSLFIFLSFRGFSLQVSIQAKSSRFFCIKQFFYDYKFSLSGCNEVNVSRLRFCFRYSSVRIDSNHLSDVWRLHVNSVGIPLLWIPDNCLDKPKEPHNRLFHPQSQSGLWDCSWLQLAGIFHREILFPCNENSHSNSVFWIDRLHTWGLVEKAGHDNSSAKFQSHCAVWKGRWSSASDTWSL